MRAKELQEELTATYKDKARVAEELVAAGRQLQIVRESNEAQARGQHRMLYEMSVGHSKVSKVSAVMTSTVARHAEACGNAVCVHERCVAKATCLGDGLGRLVNARFMPTFLGHAW